MTGRRVPNQILRLDEFPSYKGGRTCFSGHYIFEFLPEHPLANGWGWVAQHRLIGEDLVGRPLRQSEDPAIRECVHHIDEDKTNNAPTNLRVMTFSDHRSLHTKQLNSRKRGILTTEMVQEALRDRTIKQAAASLHVHSQTLRNLFPELIDPRKRASPHRIEDLETAQLIRPFAASNAHSLEDCARATNIGQITIVKACRHHGIDWVHKKRPGRPPKASRNQPTARAS